MSHSETTLQGSHGDYVVHVWENPDARYVVLLAHGISEHAHRYDHVADALVKDGAVVYAPDHYGHGLSAGERSKVDDVEAMASDLHLVYEKATSEHAGLPVVLIGHSLGGLISTRYAQRYGDELTALVLSGPVVGGNPGFEALLDMDPIPDIPLDPAALSRDPNVGVAYANDPLVYSGPIKRESLQGLVAAVQATAAGGELTMPTLWIHGELDPLAPYDATKPAMDRIRADKVTDKVYPGAMHEIYNETNQDEVIGDTIAFVNQHV